MARVSVEAAAIAWWISQPDLDVRERAARFVAVESESLTRRLREEPEGSDEYLLLLDNRAKLLKGAESLGIPVRRKNGIIVASRVRVPAATPLVSGLLRSTSTGGSSAYKFWSGLVHSSPAHVFAFFEEEQRREDRVLMGPRLRVSELETSVRLSVTAFVAAQQRVFAYLGWEAPEFEEWSAEALEIVSNRSVPSDPLGWLERFKESLGPLSRVSFVDDG